MRAVKSRREGIVTSVTALCEFDHETKTYGQSYIVGRPVMSGKQLMFLALKESQRPFWANHALPIYSSEQQKKQKEF